ncbi:hypothetical protein KSP40_PGU014860 [Platanthera guangdongensis]|uniref:Uncharacterized protein n=1 Tax=Platanthera guangdongensis TaxID=2320717 RepID=A0ABR2MKB3_9ASPA
MDSAKVSWVQAREVGDYPILGSLSIQVVDCFLLFDAEAKKAVVTKGKQVQRDSPEGERVQMYGFAPSREVPRGLQGIPYGQLEGGCVFFCQRPRL